MRAVCILVFLVAFFAGSAGAASAPDTSVSPRITLQSLMLLEEQLRNSTDAGSKATTAKRILEIGEPLLGGTMKPSAAESVRDLLKSGQPLPDDQKAYSGFWMLRAVAAVEADDERAGLEAAKVLKTLGVAESDKQAEINVIASLNIKGWLDAEKREREKREAVAEEAKRQRDVAVRRDKAARRAKLEARISESEQICVRLQNDVARDAAKGDSLGVELDGKLARSCAEYTRKLRAKLNRGDY